MGLFIHLLELKELEELEELRRELLKALRKHKRKLIRVKIYMRWEEKYKNKKIKLWATRAISLRLFKDPDNLIVSFNSLSTLIGQLRQASRTYLELVKQS